MTEETLTPWMQAGNAMRNSIHRVRLEAPKHFVVCTSQSTQQNPNTLAQVFELQSLVFPQETLLIRLYI